MRVVMAVVFVIGLALRVAQGHTTYLNPDEVFIVLSGDLSDADMVDEAGDKPPLGRLILYVSSRIASTELAVRAVPIAAGSLFPFLVYLWVARLATVESGVAAFVVLTLTPNLVALSAQARGYTLLLLFGAGALLLLDIAIRRQSVRVLLASVGCLYLAILTELSSAWVAAGAGVYTLLQLRRLPVRWVWVWGAAQVGGLGLFAYHLLTMPKVEASEKARWIAGFLRGSFPEPGTNPLTFAVMGTVKQFAYAFSSIPAGVAGLGLFSVGLALLARARVAEADGTAAANMARFVAPFGLAAVAAVLELHPYGRSRHTVVLVLFAVPPAAIALGALLRSRVRRYAAVSLMALPVWMWLADPDPNNIPASRHHLASWTAAVDYLKSAVPRGTTLLTDRETAVMLRYALLGPIRVDSTRTASGLAYIDLGPFAVAWSSLNLPDGPDFTRDVRRMQQQRGTGPSGEVWVVDGGFDANIHARLRKQTPTVPIHDLQTFDGALIVFRIGNSDERGLPSSPPALRFCGSWTSYATRTWHS